MWTSLAGFVAGDGGGYRVGNELFAEADGTLPWTSRSQRGGDDNAFPVPVELVGRHWNGFAAAVQGRAHVVVALSAKPRSVENLGQPQLRWAGGVFTPRWRKGKGCLQRKLRQAGSGRQEERNASV